ncbi:MAG: hypothetical protein M1833_000755 [Piccolia ochrophora]|nr:MAG: hypothetical protein M1833_000755 [Piccolia ochrophora]
MHPKAAVTIAAGIVASLAAPAAAFFKVPCAAPLVQERLDPVVNPGKVSGHVHTIMGGNGFGAITTYEQALASTCSSCRAPKDKSNYWTPSLYFKAKNGSFTPVQQVGGALIYYLQRTDRGKDEKSLVPFPPGFRMVAGDPFARSFAGTKEAKAISHVCLYKDRSNGFPTENCPGGLRTQVFFPSCWNGKDLDSPDHKSHVSYPKGDSYDHGDCPPEFPKRFISLFYEIIWSVDPFKNEWDGGKWPFVLSNGDPTGFGFHGDFLSGWEPAVLKDAIDNCLDGNKGGGHNGAIEYCKPLLPLTTSDEAKKCKKQTSVNERVTGLLEKLPGCNPVTPGPGRASPQQGCGDQAVLGGGSPAAAPAAPAAPKGGASPPANGGPAKSPSKAAGGPATSPTKASGGGSTPRPHHQRKHRKHKSH